MSGQERRSKGGGGGRGREGGRKGGGGGGGERDGGGEKVREGGRERESSESYRVQVQRCVHSEMFINKPEKLCWSLCAWHSVWTLVISVTNVLLLLQKKVKIFSHSSI